jgi:hypothetical protein
MYANLKHHMRLITSNEASMKQTDVCVMAARYKSVPNMTPDVAYVAFVKQLLFLIAVQGLRAGRDKVQQSVSSHRQHGKDEMQLSYNLHRESLL